MALQIILGAAGSGKTEESVKRALAIAQEGRPVLFIVPAQNTAAVERRIVHASKGGAILDLEIVSFDRLAYKVLDEVGMAQKTILNETGKNLIVRRILNDNKRDLKFFGSMQTRQGFVAKMRSALSELSEYGVSSQQLLAAGEGLKGSVGTTAAKTKDLALLSAKFSEALQENYTTANELMQLLLHSAAQSQLLKKATLFFDGFLKFTPVQYELFDLFLSLCPDIYVTATLPDGSSERQDVSSFNTASDQLYGGTGNVSDDPLFDMSRDLVFRLRDMAQKSGIAIKRDIVLSSDKRHGSGPGRRGSEELRNLSAHILREGTVPRKREKNEDVELFAAPDSKYELGLVLDEIKHLTRQEGYRYRDIAVVTPLLSDYALQARQMFFEAGVPVFIDERRPLDSNPFLEFIRSALRVVSDGFSYASVFRYLKSGLFDLSEEEQKQSDLDQGQMLSAEEIAALENYALATGVRGKKRWSEPFTRGMKNRTVAPIADVKVDATLHDLNAIRKQITEPLIKLDNALKEGGTVREQAAAVYYFLEETQAEEKLAVLASRPGSGEEYGQLFGKVCDILDQLVDLMGDQKESRKGFIELFEASLEGITAGVLPATADYVTVGDLMRSRFDKIKVLFLVGASDENLMGTDKAGGILTDADRQRLLQADSHLVLSPSVQVQRAQERFLLYRLLSQPSDRLYVSYAMSDAQGKGLRASYLFDEIQRLYSCALMTNEREKRWERKGVQALRALFPDARKTRGTALLRSDHLSKETARALFAEGLSGSVSAFERFSECPFQYFLNNGLMLEEQETAQASYADIGSAAHAVMQLTFKGLLEDGLLTPEEPLLHRPDGEERLTERVRAAYEQVRAAGNVYGFQDTQRGKLMSERIYRMALRSARYALEQLEGSDLQPALFEQPFTEQIQLKNGLPLSFRGTIDRVDLYREAEASFVRIVDYKTGSTTYDFDKQKDGRQLQLMLYLQAEERKQAMLAGVSKVYPAGVHYFHLSDTIVDLKDDASPEHARKAVEAGYKMSGRANVGQEDGVDIARHSGAIVKLTGYGRHDFYCTQDFRNLEEQAVNKAREIGERIYAGDIAIRPVAEGEERACTFCPYGGICGFSESLGFQTRKMKRFNEKENLQAMRDDAPDAAGTEAGLERE